MRLTNAVIERQQAGSLAEHRGTLPVLRPGLPSANAIFAYLQAIDESRWYANYGPLIKQLEALLSHRFGYERPVVVTAASGTAGLIATLLAFDLPERSICVLPSWTFAATAHAVLAARLTPFFFDVDRDTWALNREQLRKALPKFPAGVGAVIPVAPFGAPVDMHAWESFQDETGVRVLVDAAAGFDSVRASRIPSVVSLHATKILAGGEGGFICTSDNALLARVRACSNFGFAGSRTAVCAAINSKMSEYHAAVALADLDRWNLSRLEHARIMRWYCQALHGIGGIALQPGYGNGWVCSTTNVVLPPGSSDLVAGFLLASGIETRRWWEQGCHKQPAFARFTHSNLPATEELGSRVLGLPHFRGLRSEDVRRVADCLKAALLRG